MAKRSVSCGKRRLDTGSCHGDEANHSSEWEMLLAGCEEAVVLAHPNLCLLSLKWGITGAGHRVARRLKLVQPRVAFISWKHNHYKVQRLGALESYWRYHFPTTKTGKLVSLPAKIRSHKCKVYETKKELKHRQRLVFKIQTKNNRKRRNGI